ncbi:MAG: YbjN domain-containing protein [Propionibacteriaceae bacterium]|jgi:hypothetical protein|nr:YbjN domain-containing protein [Propionibacteriaceae bacterium]
MPTQDVFDFDRSVEQAWRRFTLRLEGVLSMMDETEPLTLEPSDGDPWRVQFCQEERDKLTARVSGADPSEGESLVLRGWQATEQGFQMIDDQDECARLGAAVVTAIREVFLEEHPIFLDSNVLAEILQEPSIADEVDSVDGSPGADQPIVYAGLDEIQLGAVVADELATILGGVVMRDQSGDFVVRAGSTMIFIRITPDAKEVRLFSVLVHDITGRSRAAEVLNDINTHARWVRFHLSRDKIILTMSVMASPFVPAHLRQAVAEVTNIADGVDELLAESLHGRTTFPDSD